MSTLEEMAAPYMTVGQAIILPISTLSAMYLVYGFYIMLFGVCIHILWARVNEHPNNKIYLGWTISLFIMTTAANFLQTWLFVRQAIIDFESTKDRNYMRFLLYMLEDRLRVDIGAAMQILASLINTSITADSMLIHRCYIIWSSRKWIAYPLIFLSFGINLIGLLSIGMLTQGQINLSSGSPSAMDLYQDGNMLNNVYLISNAVFNAILTLLTAGRIWWMTREARALMGREVDTKYRTISAIILESGIIYPATIILALVVSVATDPSAQGTSPTYLFPVAWQAAGIAPTLIIVRAATQKSVDSVDQMLTTLSFAQGNEDIERRTGRFVVPTEQSPETGSSGKSASEKDNEGME